MIRKLTLFLLIFTSLYSAPLPKYNLSICTIFKNEAKCLKEWIEYHRLIGVNHFYLYNVESTDNYLEVLLPYLRQNIVTLVQWPNLSLKMENDDAVKMLGTRIPAYENAVKYRAYNETNWLVFVDIDEFLVAPAEMTLSELLAKYSDYPGVTIPSDFFDASDKFTLPKRKLVIESTDLSAPPETPIAQSIEKTIFRPKQVKSFTWPPYKFQFEENKNAFFAKRSELRINNYINKRVNYFVYENAKDRLQIDTRYYPEEEKNILLKHYKIKDQEKAIFKHIPEVKKRLGL